MKRLGRRAAAWTLVLTLTLAGCIGSDGRGHDPLFEADILSDTRIDGDIDSQGAITIGSGEIFAGVDPDTGREYRGFLSFPLTSVPANADVQYASLELFVVDLAPFLITPFTLDLVSFTPPLVPSDFSDTQLPPLVSRNFDVFPSDLETLIRIDVTPMVREAFRRGLVNGQFRLLLDVRENVGLLTVDDPLTITATAPLLHIEYF